MSRVGTFVKTLFTDIWRVHYPEFEKPAGYGLENEKPKAQLMPELEVERDERDLSEDEVKQVGVVIAEATYAVSGYTWYGIAIFLWITYFLYALDNQVIASTTLTVTASKEYLPDGSSVNSSTAYTVQALFTAIAKLVVAKIADIFGRFTALCVTVFCYTLGFLIMAVSQNSADYTGGVVFYGIGNSGVQMVIWIVLADFLSARYRMLGYGLVSLPMFIVFATGPMIQQSLTIKNWRWLPGMFCIMIPVVTGCLMAMLWYLEFKARRTGLVPKHPYLRKGIHYALWNLFLDSDLIGLLLLVGGFAMIVVALIRGGSQYTPWSTDWVIAVLTVGPIILLFILPTYEYFIAPRPFFRRSWLNKEVIIAMLLAFFDNMVFGASFQVIFNWIIVTYGFDSTAKESKYVTFSDTLALTLFGVIAGLIIAYTRRYKWFLVAGTAVRMIGYGLQIRYRHLNSSIVQVVWGQIVQGIGGAFLGEILTLMSQITVRHQDQAMVTSVILTLFSLGNSVGTAVYQAILNDELPKKLDQYAPMLSEAQKQAVALSPTSAFMPASSFGLGLQHGTPAGDAVSTAYNEASVHVVYFAIGISAFLFVLSFFAQDWYLPRSNNVVSDELPEKNPFRMQSDRTYDEAIQVAEKGGPANAALPGTQDETLPSMGSDTTATHMGGLAPPKGEGEPDMIPVAAPGENTEKGNHVMA
ncbi:transmembrane transporter [Malassezia pachydermatis]|uniref:Drug:h+ antiporter n=1 Tax=Malassezia pachydermatis TaxID=77020 RepID=A0A0N0RS54_9BASI|nr:drug:h+ antiporter [Malassezia pachydermatis]KOS13572.1 drug:h+ antiporter [Malassezia pachydermatis]